MLQFISKKLIKKGLDNYNVTKDFNEEGNIYIDEEEDMSTLTDFSAMDEQDQDCEAAIEGELDELIAALEEVKQLSEDDRKIARAGVTKVCATFYLYFGSNVFQIMKLGNRVFNSQVMQEALAAQCVKAKMKPKKMIRMVATC